MVEFFWSKQLSKLSVACNVALGVFLLVLVVYAKVTARHAEEVGAPQARKEAVVENAERLTAESNPTEAETADSHPAGLPRGWVAIPLSGNRGRPAIYRSDRPQELTPLAVAALEMTSAEVDAIEALSLRVSAKLGKPGSLSDTFGYIPPVQPSTEEADLVCKEFATGCAEILGELRGAALADAALMSNSFLTKAYWSRRDSYRFRKETQRRKEQLVRVGKPEPIDFPGPRIQPMEGTILQGYLPNQRTVIHPSEEDPEQW